MSLAQVRSNLSREKPLIICDIDEVVLHFIAPLEEFLDQQNARLCKKSFGLNGNIFDKITGDVIPDLETSKLIGEFHRESVDQQPLVTGALETLNNLTNTFQIIFLTNISEELTKRRAQHLASLGLPYPILQNTGSKAEAVSVFACHITDKIIFIDDLPPHHIRVKEAAPAVQCIHYMADEDFRAIANIPPHIGEKANNWQDIESLCKATLTAS